MPAQHVYLETFGCQMNELDSELVMGQLRALGYRFTGDPDKAQVVLYNTCSVREHAEQKVWSRLGELALRKREQPSLVVGVLGCLAERDGVALVKRMPVVDILCGPGELDKLPALLDNAVRTRASMLADDPDVLRLASSSASQVALQGSTSRRSAVLAAAEDSLEMLDLSRAISPIDVESPLHHVENSYDPAATPRSRFSAYVRITRGCNKFCTYCVVPFTRGAEIHRPPDHIVDECKRLADSGVIEITLLGQTVNHYRFEHGSAITVNGLTQPQKGRSYAGGHRRDPFAGDRTTTFSDLLARIHDEVPGILRLRFVTSYPRDFGDDVLEVIRDCPRICRYLHVPAQSGSDRILKLMNRGYTAGEYIEFLDRAKAFLHQPEIGRPLMVSGDFIVGFPTETDEDFAASVALLERARYKNSFIFKYSPRPGTPAIDKVPDDVPESIKRQRNGELLDVQNRIGEEVGLEQVGAEFSVLIQGLSKREAKRQLAAPAHRERVSLTVSARPRAADSAGVETTDRDPAGVIQLSGRTDGDQIVFIDVPSMDALGVPASSVIGSIITIRVTSVKGLGLVGIPVGR